MSFYWIKTRAFIKKICSNFTWDIPNDEKIIYLTFDDGPIPEITNWVLEELKKQDAKATFFCIGNNIKKYPDVFERLVSQGHSVGNHTYNHLNGWKTSTEEYIKNVLRCEQELSITHSQFRSIFRPPYGKLKPSQSRKLIQLGYEIMMWDVLSADFDTEIGPEKCLENVLNNVKSGSIIVFHDSVKAFPNLKYTLPKTLEILTKQGFVFKKIA